MIAKLSVGNTWRTRLVRLKELWKFNAKRTLLGINVTAASLTTSLTKTTTLVSKV